jgi:hypothetical protein
MIILKIILNSFFEKTFKKLPIAKQNKNNKFQISSIKLE